MAKPRSFRCRAFFPLDLAPKCKRHGMGRGGRCWGPGRWLWGGLVGPAPAWRARGGLRCAQAGTCAPGLTAVQVPGGPHILGFGVGPPRTGSSILGRAGRFSVRKEPPVATSGTPVACSHWEQQKLLCLFFL